MVKPGDRVICLVKTSGLLTYNKIYKVESVSACGYWIRVRDDSGSIHGFDSQTLHPIQYPISSNPEISFLDNLHFKRFRL